MGNQQPKLLAGLPVVVIVGGGYAGTAVAKALDASGKVNVIIIERKEYFLHNVGAPRAAVTAGFEKNILIPYTNLLKNGSVIHAQVTRIESQAIYLYGYDEPIKFDYLVVATGSTYPFPGKVSEFSYQSAREKFKLVQNHIQNAANITIVGGGPVGIELAGEIATDLPDKKITLIHSHPQLMDDALRSEFRNELKNQLERLHVNVILGQRVNLDEFEHKEDNGLGTSYVVGPRQVTTDQGSSITTDLIFLATGTKVNTHTWKNTLPLAEDGRIKVNSFLQVEGQPRIYAIGDAAAIGRKMAWYAGLHGAHAATNILASIAKKEQKPYAGDPPAAAFVTVGRNGGAGQMPNKKGTVVKSTMVRMIKSKSLFVDKYWSTLNAKRSSPPVSPDSSPLLPATRVRNVSAVFGLPDTQSQQTTKILTKGLPVDNTLEIVLDRQAQAS